jgi:hypothetical protein
VLGRLGLGGGPRIRTGFAGLSSAPTNVPTLHVQKSGVDTHTETEPVDLVALATTNDADGFTTSGVDLYVNSLFVGAMTSLGGGAWSLAMPGVIAGTQNYVAKRRTSLGTLSSATWTVAVSGAPFFASAVNLDFSNGADTAYTIDDTNATITSRNVCTRQSDGTVAIVYYRNSDGAPTVAIQLNGVGQAVHYPGTITGNGGITDNHNSICCWWDARGFLNVILENHSAQECYWVGTSTSDFTMTNAGKVSPRVPGGGALEANSTYHDPHPFNDGRVALAWRTGGSGDGDLVIDLQAADGSWTRQNTAALSGHVDTVSFYLNPIMVEKPGSLRPDRLWVVTQVREATGAATARGLWGMYSDDYGVSFKARDGTALPSHPRLSDLGPALIENIPNATTDPNYSFYFGIQGSCVGTDGALYIAMYYGAATAPVSGNYGTQTGDLTIYLWRATPDSAPYTKVAVKALPMGTCIGASRPTVIVKGGKALVFYSARYSTDPASSGKFYCSSCAATTLTGMTEQVIFGRNIVQNVYDSSFVFDRWALFFSDTVSAIYLATKVTGTPGSNPATAGPGLLSLSFGAVAPVIRDLPEIAALPGSTVTLDYDYRGDGFVDDGTTHVSQLTDRSTNARHATQATSSKRGALVVNALGVRSSALLDGVDDFFQYTRGATRAAPASAHYWALQVLAQRSWTTGDRLLDDCGSLEFQTTGTPTVRQNSGTSVNSDGQLTLNVFHKLLAVFTGSTADFVQVDRNNIVTGASAGNTVSGTNLTIGAGSGGSVPANIELLEAAGFLGGDLTYHQQKDVDGYLALYYNSLLP